MKLTEGALSMLLKRYRAVLFKCRSLNWLAGMVLAGGLVLGGAGLAGATEAYTPETLNGPLERPIPLESGDTIGAGIYTISQGANFTPTEVTANGQTRANYVGVVVGNGVTLNIVSGTTFTGSSFVQNKNLKPNAAGIFLVQTGGKITINPGVTFSKNTFVAHGAITSTKTPDVGTAAEIDISGDATGPQIVFSDNTSGGAGAAISNFSITKMTVGNVLFKNNTVNNDINGAGGGAVFMGASSTNLINGAIFDGNKVTSEEGAWGGAIATRGTDNGAGGKVSLNNGTMTIGNSAFTGNYAAQRGGAIYNAFYNDFDGYSTTLTTAPSNISTVLIDNSTFSQNSSAKGGAIYNDGSKDSTNTPGKLTISNSTFTGNTASTAGGAIYNDTNAELTLIGTNTFTNNSAGQGQDIYNAGTLTITEGETILGSGIYNAGVLNITGTSTAGAKLKITGPVAWSELMAGDASKIVLAGNSSSNMGELRIVNTTPLEIAVGSLTDTAGAGKIAMGSNTSLHVDMLNLTSTTEANKIQLGAASSYLSANQLSLGGNVNLVMGTVTVNGTAGSKLSSSGATANTLTLQGAAAANAVLNIGNSQGVVSNLPVKGGEITAGITVTKGTVNVNAGEWALQAGTLDVQTNGILTIGGGSNAAVLDTTQGGTFKSATAGTASAGTSVGSNGTLIVASSAFLNEGFTDLKDSSNINKIYVDAGGLLSVTGFSDENEFTVTQFTTLKGNVLDSKSAGMLYLDGAKITAKTNGGNLVDGTASGNDTSVGSTGVVLAGATVNVDANSGNEVTLNGGYAAKTLTFSKVTQDASVKVNTVTLLGGGAANPLVTSNDSTKALSYAVQGNQALNLGLANDPAISLGGTLTGNVTFGSDSELNVAGGKDSVYTIDGTVGADSGTDGTVSANLATLQVTEKIAGVGAVNTSNNGTITVAGDINTGTITMNGGIIQVGGVASSSAAPAMLGRSAPPASVVEGDITTADSTGTVEAKSGNNTVSTGNGSITFGGATTVSADATLEIIANGGNVALAGSTLNPGGTLIITASNMPKGGDKATDGTGKVTSSAALTATSITTTGGDVDITGTLKADEVTANGGDIKASGDITVETLIATSNGGEGASLKGGNIKAGANDIIANSITADEEITAKDLTAGVAQAGSTPATPGSVSAKTLTASGDVTVYGTATNQGLLNLTGEGASAKSTAANLSLTNTKATVNDFEISTATTISGGSFKGQDGSTVTLGSGATSITGGAVTSFDTLAGSSAITLGDAGDQSASSLSVGQLSNNGTLSMGGNAKAPALAAIGYVGSGTPDDTKAGAPLAAITVNNNAALALGSSNIADAAKATAANGGLYIAKPIDLSSKGITLGTDATANVSSGGLAAGPGSSTVVNVADLTADGPAAIKGAVTADDGAKLTISGATVGQTFTLASDGVTIDDSNGKAGWSGANFASDNPLISFTGTKSESGDSMVITAAQNSASNFLPDASASTVALLNSVADKLGPKGMNSPQRGIAFLSSVLAMLNSSGAQAGGAAASAASVQAEGQPAANALVRATPRAAADAISSGAVQVASSDARLVTKTIEGAERMVIIGAVPQMTRLASQAAAEAVTQRTSMAIPSGLKSQQVNNLALWVMPLYQSTNGAGMDAGTLDADFNGAIGGIALGADYTFENAIRAGISFNIGGGYATGGGDFADTTNSMNFWGLGAYAGWSQNNIGISADLSYTSAYNKLKQDLPSEMSSGTRVWKDLKADVRSWALATGLRGEYKFETSALDIIPHLGVRYMYLNAEDYKVKSDGTVLKGDAVRQNIWTFPVGVSFSKNIQTANGWNVKPMADLMIVPALGDINAKPNVRFSGTEYKVDDLNTQIMDHVSYQGLLGVEFGSNNLNFGLTGSAQFGEKTSGYGISGTFRYEF